LDYISAENNSIGLASTTTVKCDAFSVIMHNNGHYALQGYRF